MTILISSSKLSLFGSTAELSIFCMLRMVCAVVIEGVSYELSVRLSFIKMLRGGGLALQ